MELTHNQKVAQKIFIAKEGDKVTIDVTRPLGSPAFLEMEVCFLKADADEEQMVFLNAKMEDVINDPILSDAIPQIRDPLNDYPYVHVRPANSRRAAMPVKELSDILWRNEFRIC